MTAANLPPDDPKDNEPDAQAVAVLVEKLTLAGHQVHVGKTGDFLVTRWGLSRHCIDDIALSDFARQLGVKS